MSSSLHCCIIKITSYEFINFYCNYFKIGIDTYQHCTKLILTTKSIVYKTYYNNNNSNIHIYIYIIQNSPTYIYNNINCYH